MKTKIAFLDQYISWYMHDIIVPVTSETSVQRLLVNTRNREMYWSKM